jgi:hypothetical protein
VVPLALASTMPAIVASPNTAKTTGREPVSVNVAPFAIERAVTDKTMTSGPPGCASTTGVGSNCPHQLPKVRDVESNVEAPHPSETVELALTDGA